MAVIPEDVEADQVSWFDQASHGKMVVSYVAEKAKQTATPRQ